MDINNIKEWKKYKSNEYIIIETGTLSFGKDMKKILREIKSKSHTFLCLLLLSLSKLSFFNPIFLILIAAIKKRSFEN